MRLALILTRTKLITAIINTVIIFEIELNLFWEALWKKSSKTLEQLKTSIKESIRIGDIYSWLILE